MALDLIAFRGTRAGTVALQNIAGALGDSHVTTVGNQIIVPSTCNKVIELMALSEATAGSLTSRVQLSSPSLRAGSLIELSSWVANGAIVAANQIPGVDPNFMDFKETPVSLQSGEALTALSAVDVAAVAEDVTLGVILTDGNIVNMPAGARIETVLATGGSAAVANNWTPSALTLQQTLRQGTYALVGAKVASTTCQLARFIFGNQGNRPGVVGCALPSSKDPMRGMFRYGRMGTFGLFDSQNPPQLELYCSVADAAAVQYAYLDVIKVG
jgi:hypothetical protein